MTVRRARRIGAGALALALLAAAWFTGRGRPARAPATAVTPAPRAQVVAPNAPAPPDETGMLPPPETASFIDEVILSSPQVCPGEAFTVTVAAHDPEGADEGLYFVVAGARVGNPVVLSYGGTGDQEIPVTVFSKRGPGLIDRRSVTVRVRSDCDRDEPRLEIAAQPVRDRALGFSATLRGRVDEPMSSYRWDFGDGVPVETARPFAEHAFGRPPGKAIQSNVVVSVAGVTASGRTIRGATAVPFFDRYLRNKLEAGVLTPEVVVDSVEVGGGDATLRAHVHNRETFALELRDVEAQAMPCDAAGDPATTSRGAAGVLMTDVVPPGDSSIVTRLPLASLPAGTCRVVLTVRGSAPTGEAVELQLPMVLEEPAPTDVVDEDSADPDRRRLFARISAAQRLLGRDTVTQEEIDWLVRQGRVE